MFVNSKLALAFVVVSGLGLSACTDPYDPGQRALGGAGIGAAGGALIGGALGGGRGALAGAVLGGGAGAVTGAATTPNRPYYNQGYGQPVYQQPYQPAPAYYQPRYGY